MPRRSKIEFPGHDGGMLAGLLESPDGEPRATALFAHCFTCGKDIAAASRIARALVARGFEVLRFDFTGLGNSDGDFANTHFSSNVADLVAAAAWLREQGRPPGLLIGHSLGGTAVLKAAHRVPECRGVATLGAPADARHVAQQFACDIETIERDGSADVKLAGRDFTIRREFLDDIRDTDVSHLADLRMALLIMHAPADETVSVDEAERIYKAAKHPKSFVDLHGADHLLSRAADAEYAAAMIAAWASRLVGAPCVEARPVVAPGQVRVAERDHRFAQDVHSDRHHWIADEPAKVGGGDTGPDPYEQLLAALGTCTAMTLRMYAERKGLALNDVSVTLQHDREHVADCEGCDDGGQRIDVLTRTIALSGDLDEAARASLLRIADRCPVHRTLEGPLEIRTRPGEWLAGPAPTFAPRQPGHTRMPGLRVEDWQ